MGVPRGPQDQLVVFAEIEEARVAFHHERNELDDFRQHLVQWCCCRHPAGYFIEQTKVEIFGDLPWFFTPGAVTTEGLMDRRQQIFLLKWFSQKVYCPAFIAREVMGISP